MRQRVSTGGPNRAAQRPWCLALCWRFCLLLPIAVIVALFVFSSIGDKPDGGFADRLFTGNFAVHDSERIVKSAVYFPEHLLLLTNSTKHLSIAKKIHCLFHGRVKSVALGLDSGTVRCAHPGEEQQGRVRGKKVTIVVDGKVWDSNARYPEEESWETLVYSGVDMQEDGEILLFAKGIVTGKKERRPDVEDLRCLFGKADSTVKVATDATEACQEGIRCKLPPASKRGGSVGKPITIQWKDKVFPSAVEYSLDGIGGLLQRGRKKKERYEICACTVIYNGAKFLREWIMYHAFMGVERWLLYDNNSDDDLKEVVRDMAHYNVSRHHWPWLKTQEAAFSHCSVRAERAGCKWVGFFDVDEFFFTKSFLPDSPAAPSGMTQLKALIEKSRENVMPAKSKLGQVKVRCVSFGPSGLRALLPGGQMVSYTCRETKVDRHKSLVLLAAMDRTRCGIIHHFDLKPGYGSAEWRKAHATVNHYKYPVWDDFALKFVRRVSAYVADWDKEEHLDSKDRVQGLGTVPKEPSDWPARFCEEQDTGLRDFVLKQFGDPETKKLPWE